MFKKTKKILTTVLVVAVITVMAVPAYASYNFTFEPESSLAPVVKKSGSTWYYYINGEIDTSYTGLASNSNGTWWIEDGIVTFNYKQTYNWAADAGYRGGWQITGSKVENGGNVTSTSYIDDDNAFTGKIIIGDSRCVQLYTYNNYANYDEASFEATWGGRYNPNASTTTTGGNKSAYMAVYIEQSLKTRGYCDVYLFASINDMTDYNESDGTGYEIATAEELSNCKADFNGTTVYPTIHIIGVVDAATNDSHYKGTDVISSWNSVLRQACTQHNASDKNVTWEYLDWASCITGYSDGLHYDDNSLKNIWAKINECQHEYKVYKTDATCTKSGEEHDICVKCGNVETSMIGAYGHSLDNGVVTKEATCKETGILTHTCATCGATMEDVIEKTNEHAWDSGAVTKQATCNENGINTYTCTICGATQTETISATGHDYTTKVTEPTCVDGGYTTYTCSECGDIYTDNYTNALGHDYTAVVTDPACDKEGYTTYTCSHCNDIFIGDYTDATGHEYTATVTKPTCIKGGYTTHICSICGDKYTDNETDATGHIWDNGTITKEPTRTEEGEMTYTCTVCGNTMTETIQALTASGEDTETDNTEIDGTDVLDTDMVDTDVGDAGSGDTGLTDVTNTDDTESTEINNTDADSDKTIETNNTESENTNDDDIKDGSIDTDVVITNDTIQSDDGEGITTDTDIIIEDDESDGDDEITEKTRAEIKTSITSDTDGIEYTNGKADYTDGKEDDMEGKVDADVTDNPKEITAVKTNDTNITLIFSLIACAAALTLIIAALYKRRRAS